MKIRLTKKRNSMSLRISAESGAEGIDLKDIVMAAGKNGLRADSFMPEFQSRGYSGGITKETRNVKRFSIYRAQAGPVKPDETQDITS